MRHRELVVRVGVLLVAYALFALGFSAEWFEFTTDCHQCPAEIREQFRAVTGTWRESAPVGGLLVAGIGIGGAVVLVRRSRTLGLVLTLVGLAIIAMPLLQYGDLMTLSGPYRDAITVVALPGTYATVLSGLLIAFLGGMVSSAWVDRRHHADSRPGNAPGR